MMFDDFTESAYRERVREAKRRLPFRLFAACRESGPGVLWRHDIDMSVHRALALAKIEASEDVRATYFVHLHSEFYNAFEREITTKLVEIATLGHDLGLHFDPAWYGDAILAEARFVGAMAAERASLERLLGVTLTACSFHNPDAGKWPAATSNELAGLVNAYGAYITQHYRYCSDSNGYWRFDALQDVLRGGSIERLHVLTHPEWWVPEPMSPRRRVERCVNGRAASTLARYDRILEQFGRTNIR